MGSQTSHCELSTRFHGFRSQKPAASITVSKPDRECRLLFTRLFPGRRCRIGVLLGNSPSSLHTTYTFRAPDYGHPLTQRYTRCRCRSSYACKDTEVQPDALAAAQRLCQGLRRRCATRSLWQDQHEGISSAIESGRRPTGDRLERGSTKGDGTQASKRRAAWLRAYIRLAGRKGAQWGPWRVGCERGAAYPGRGRAKWNPSETDLALAGTVYR